MRSIWKFDVPVADRLLIQMPEGAKVLCVQVQNETPCIWAKVDPGTKVPVEVREFRVYGTGHNIDESEALEYVGTFQLLGGSFVGHLFEVKR